VTLGGDVDDVRVARMNTDAAYLASVFEADVLPGLAGIGGLVDAVAVRNISANRRLTHADIDDVRDRIQQCRLRRRNRS
jgi:hypothetical protein